VVDTQTEETSVKEETVVPEEGAAVTNTEQETAQNVHQLNVFFLKEMFMLCFKL
jgi:hypothetical protein